MSTTDLPDDDTLEALSEERVYIPETDRSPQISVLCHRPRHGRLPHLVPGVQLNGALGAPYYSTSASRGCAGLFPVPLFPALQQEDAHALGDWACMLLAASACIYFILELDTIIYRVGVAPPALTCFFHGYRRPDPRDDPAHQRLDSSPPSPSFSSPMRCSENTFPIALAGTGATASRVFSSYITGMDGMLSTPLATSASFVFLFFPVQRAFLASTGAGQFFIDIAMAVAGGKRGRPAKGGRHRQCPVRYDFRQLGGQRGGLGTFTIPMMIRSATRRDSPSRRGSRGLHGRADDASHPRGGGVHHRRADRHPVSRRGPRHSHPGDPLFRLDLLHDRP